MHQHVAGRGIAADRDGHLADAEDVEHVELPGREGNDAAVVRGPSSSVKVSCVSLPDAPDHAGTVRSIGSVTAGFTLVVLFSAAIHTYPAVEFALPRAGCVDDVREPLQELVAEVVVLLALLRRHLPSSAIARVSSTARASKCQW